ncbi:hypothetical protein ACLOJK_022677, partial [Asimina triloba]
ASRAIRSAATRSTNPSCTGHDQTAGSTLNPATPEHDQCEWASSNERGQRSTTAVHHQASSDLSRSCIKSIHARITMDRTAAGHGRTKMQQIDRQLGEIGDPASEQHPIESTSNHDRKQ